MYDYIFSESKLDSTFYCIVLYKKRVYVQPCDKGLLSIKKKEHYSPPSKQIYVINNMTESSAKLINRNPFKGLNTKWY